MTVARNAKVIFIKIDRYQDENLEREDGGFKIDADELYDLILDNIDPLNIKLLVMAFSKNGVFYNRFREIFNQGVYIIASMGNDGTLINTHFSNKVFPTYIPEIRKIGSIDHENRGTMVIIDSFAGIPIYDFDPFYYSKKDDYSGSSTYCQLYAESQGENIDYTHCSSYDPNQDEGISFVAPGNGIPVISGSSGDITFFYGRGTSFAAPFFAAMVLVSLYAFGEGWKSRTTLPVEFPKGSEIDNIFKHVSSRTSWDSRLGWGNVHLQQLYEYAYELGRASVPLGGGSNSGFWR